MKNKQKAVIRIWVHILELQVMLIKKLMGLTIGTF